MTVGTGTFKKLQRSDLDLYDYLPINLTMAKRAEMGSAALQLVYYTKDVRLNIFKWYVLYLTCKLDLQKIFFTLLNIIIVRIFAGSSNVPWKKNAWHLKGQRFSANLRTS